MVVKEFYGEKIVDKHCHKDEQVYWDKFSTIHNKWFKFSGLVPQAAENYASRWAFFYIRARAGEHFSLGGSGVGGVYMGWVGW